MAQYYISPPPVGPLGRIIGSVFAVLLIIGAVVFGFFLLAAAVALGVLVWVGLLIRAWWLRRKGGRGSPDSGSRKPETIEAEYTVISRRRD